MVMEVFWEIDPEQEIKKNSQVGKEFINIV